MLSWHCDTDLTPGSSTLSCRLLDEPLPSGQTVRWCLGCCCGCECSDSVLEITSMRPDRAGLFSCSMFSWMVESSLLSASRSEEICCRSDGATQREVKSLNIAPQSSKSLHYEMKLKLSPSFKSMCILPGSDCGFLAADLHVCGVMRRSFISWILPLILSLVSL